jgi:hypothetical protein
MRSGGEESRASRGIFRFRNDWAWGAVRRGGRQNRGPARGAGRRASGERTFTRGGSLTRKNSPLHTF